MKMQFGWHVESAIKIIAIESLKAEIRDIEFWSSLSPDQKQTHNNKLPFFIFLIETLIFQSFHMEWKILTWKILNFAVINGCWNSLYK